MSTVGHRACPYPPQSPCHGAEPPCFKGQFPAFAGINRCPGLKIRASAKRLSAFADIDRNRPALCTTLMSTQVDNRTSKDPDFQSGCLPSNSVQIFAREGGSLHFKALPFRVGCHHSYSAINCVICSSVACHSFPRVSWRATNASRVRGSSAAKRHPVSSANQSSFESEFGVSIRRT